MKWVMCTFTLLLLMAFAVGVPSTAWGEDSAPDRRAQIDRPVDVDHGHQGKARDPGLRSFEIADLKISLQIGRLFGIQITIVEVNDTVPAEVQTPTGEKRYKVGPDLDEDPWEDIK